MNKKVIYLLFLLISFLVSNAAKANLLVDSIPKKRVDSTLVLSFHNSIDSLFLGPLKSIDTSDFNVTNFDVLYKQSKNYSTLSNLGSPAQSMVTEYHFNGGYDLKNQSFAHILNNYSNIRYLIPIQAFSELYYTMGANKEQQFDVSFTRELFPRFILGLEFALQNSPGIYKNNKSQNARVYFTGRYSTDNERYGIISNYYHNKINIGENGGLLDDFEFESNTESDRRLIPVQLQDAQNMVKESGFGFEQYFNFIGTSPKKISDSSFKPRKIQFGRITHSFSYHKNQLVYTEDSPLAAFYQSFDVVLDSNNTYDSTYQLAIKNKLYLSSLGYKKFNNDVPFYIYAGVEHAYIVQADSIKKSVYHQLSPFGGIRISLLRSSYLDGKATIITGGYGSGDLHLEAGIKQFLGTSERNLGNLFFRTEVINQSPSWITQRYQSNHFRWENSFSNSKFVNFHGGYSFKGFTVGGRLQVMDKLIYFNKFARPQQSTGTTNLRQIYTEFHLRPGKFELLGRFDYQKVSNDTILHIPEYSGMIKIAFVQDLFSKAATIKPGLRFRWFSSYYADAYMPALRTFYLQDEKNIGNFPYLDVFLTLKVKRANLFVQYENLFGLLGNYTYYTTPHYPMRDPRLYFGVKWRFFK